MFTLLSSGAICAIIADDIKLNLERPLWPENIKKNDSYFVDGPGLSKPFGACRNIFLLRHALKVIKKDGGQR